MLGQKPCNAEHNHAGARGSIAGCVVLPHGPDCFLAAIMQDVSRAFSIVPADKSVLSLLEKIRLQVIAAGVDASQIKKEMPEAAKMWVFSLSLRITRVGAWPRFVVAGEM